MADSTSPYMLLRRPIPLVIETPQARVTIEFSSPAQGNLQAFASTSPDVIDEVRKYLALAFRDRASVVVDELAKEIADLVELGRGNDLVTALPRLRQVMEAMGELERFAEGPFGDPRIEGFGFRSSPPKSRRLAPDLHEELPRYTGSAPSEEASDEEPGSIFLVADDTPEPSGVIVEDLTAVDNSY